MFAFLLQDWTTIQAGSATVTQTEPFWLDTSPYLDLVAFMEVRQVSTSGGNLFMAYQTAPTKDEILFTAMNDIVSTAAVPMSVGVLVAVMLRDTAICPLCHWLRWQLSPVAGITSYEATFRIWISASRPGALADATTADPSSYNDGFEGGPAWTDGPTTLGNSGSPPAPLNMNVSQVGLHAIPNLPTKGSTSAWTPTAKPFNPKAPFGTRAASALIPPRTSLAWQPMVAPTAVQPIVGPGVKVIKS